MRRTIVRPALAALLLAGCTDPVPPTLTFDQAPEITVEAGESVNVSLSWSEGPSEGDGIAWSASCGQVMGLLIRGSYLAPDRAGDCEVTATSVRDPFVFATLRVVVTEPLGGGAVRWTRHLASDHDDAVRRLAPTPDGGVVALVETWGDLGGVPQGDLDVVLLRYDPAGTLLWAASLATDTREFAGDVAVGPDGVAWVVGSTYGALGGPSAGENDAFLARIEHDGELAWIRQFGSDRADTATGVAVAADGDVWVAGWTEGDLDGALGGADGFLRRFSPEGAARFTRQVGGTGIDFLIGVAPDGDGAVVVGSTDGQVAAPSAGGQDGFFVRFDAEGDEVLRHQFGGPEGDRAYGVAARPGGGFVVVGALGDDAFVDAYDSHGERAWTYAVATPGEDLAQGAAVAPDGSVYVVGSTTGDVGGPNVGFFDAFALRLDPTGAPLWARRVGSAADDYGWAIARTPDGDVVIGGRTDGLLADGYGGGGDGFLRRMGP